VSTPGTLPGMIRIWATKVPLGLCTGFLADPDTRKIAIRISSGEFPLPEDPDVSLILAASGVGVLSFLSLLDTREAGIGNVLVIYSGMSEEFDAKIVELLQTRKDEGKITDLLVAPAQGGGIMDIMKQNINMMWKYWEGPLAWFYLAATEGLSEGDLKEFMIEVRMEEGKMNRQQAEQFCAASLFVFKTFEP
jgi:sulfite reductase alpha subunit-like flavoprotein